MSGNQFSKSPGTRPYNADMSKAKPTSAIDLAGIFSAAQQAIALVAPDAAILFANQAFFELCSAKPTQDDDEELDALPSGVAR